MSEPILVALIGATVPLLIALIQAISSLVARRMEDRKQARDHRALLVPEGYVERKIDKSILKEYWWWLLIFVIIGGLLGYFVGVGIQKRQHPASNLTTQATDRAKQTQEQSLPETLTAWAEAQAVVVSNTKPTFNPTKTLQPTTPPTITISPQFAPTSTSTSAPQPPRSNQPMATSIPPTPTHIPPSDIPLPSTEMPILTATNVTLLSFNSLPSAQGWSYSTDFTYIPDTDVFSVDGSQLHMNTMGRGGSGFAYIRETTIDHQLLFTLSVLAQVTDYGDQTNENPWGFALSVYIGSEAFDIGISPGRIIGGAGDQLISSTIDVYQLHEYRIEGQAGQNFEVFVDDNSLGTFAPATTNNSQDAIYFGDGTAGANAQVDIAGYSFTQSSR